MSVHLHIVVFQPITWFNPTNNLLLSKWKDEQSKFAVEKWQNNTPIINFQKTTFSHVCSTQFDTTGLDIITRDMTHTLLSSYAVIEWHKMAVGGKGKPLEKRAHVRCNKTNKQISLSIVVESQTGRARTPEN